MKNTVSLALLALTAAASAQPSNGRFVLTASNDVTPATPSTTISVYAAWDPAGPPAGPNTFVLGAVNYDLVATQGEFTATNLILGMNPPNNAGTLNGSRVDGAAIAQVHIPKIGVLGSVDNPILLAEYSWTTTNFTFRSIDLFTENTTNFSVFPEQGGLSINLVPQGQFTPGAGSFTVIPAASTAALVTAALLTTRRRRTGELS